MLPNVKSRAEALAVALEVGAAGVDDVVAWAEGVIDAEVHPHWSVCELATMSRSYEPDVIRALREVPGEPDEAWVRKEVIRQLHRGLAEDRSRADQIASVLYDLAMAEELPDEALRSVAWWAWDALSLADDRLVEETRDQVIDQ